MRAAMGNKVESLDCCTDHAQVNGVACATNNDDQEGRVRIRDFMRPYVIYAASQNAKHAPPRHNPSNDTNMVANGAMVLEVIRKIINDPPIA